LRAFSSPKNSAELSGVRPSCGTTLAIPAILTPDTLPLAMIAFRQDARSGVLASIDYTSSHLH
jgi:hypothetical protein